MERGGACCKRFWKIRSAIARNFRLARDMSDPHPLGTQCVGVIDLFEVCCEHRTFVPDKRLE